MKSKVKPFVCGGFACMTAEFCTFPIDTTKIRLQIQGQLIDDAKVKKVRYKGMSHAIVKIFRNEGLKALYNGIKPALLRQGTYGTINIGLYHSFKRMISVESKNESFGRNMCAGMMAGAISSSLCNPTDVLKVRSQARTMQAHSNGNSGMVAAFKDIYRVEGMRGLYRGVVPTAKRATIVTGVELPMYDLAKRCLVEMEILGDTELTHFISSCCAGFCAAAASTPVDVIKTRMMNQRVVDTPHETRKNKHIYKSSLDCLTRTWKNEGALALYKGFVPTLFRMGPWNIVFFMSFEQYKKLLEDV